MISYKTYINEGESLYIRSTIQDILDNFNVGYKFNKVMNILKEAKADAIPSDIDDSDEDSISMKVNNHDVVIYADKVVIDGKEYLFDTEEESDDEEPNEDEVEADEEKDTEEDESEEDKPKPRKSRKKVETNVKIEKEDDDNVSK